MVGYSPGVGHLCKRRHLLAGLQCAIYSVDQIMRQLSIVSACDPEGI
jgi:hypothetical protein